MEKEFRSRGIRMLKEINEKAYFQEKIYYDKNSIDQENVTNKEILDLVDDDIIKMFEYSEINGEVDTLNYHVNLNKNFKKIYERLNMHEKKYISRVISTLDPTIKVYTVGYRLRNDCILDRSFYFYPTILKKDRYGIKGITDVKKIMNQIVNISNQISNGNKDTVDEILEFGMCIKKFKGISFHIGSEKISYKIYGRVDEDKLERILRKYVGKEVSRIKKYIEKYGDVVLVCQRICDGLVTGYNVYFMK